MNQTIDRQQQLAACNRAAALWKALRSMREEAAGLHRHLADGPDVEAEQELAMLLAVMQQTREEYRRIITAAA